MEALPDSPQLAPMDTSQTEEAGDGEPNMVDPERGFPSTVNNNSIASSAIPVSTAATALSQGTIAAASSSKAEDDDGPSNNVKGKNKAPHGNMVKIFSDYCCLSRLK